MERSLKHLTARSVKWNIIDRIGSQILYAVTGIILARQLSQEAFGLVGAIMIFQAFALLMIDSGFSYALIQRKRPTEEDYSSVFWFNMIVATVIYGILWVCAPLIADCFGGDIRLIGLSRVMFLSFIINASAIVQTNRLMKRMDFRPIAITNAIGLVAGAFTGITLAYTDAGAWAIVWQSIAIQGTKSAALWIWCRWTPMLRMSWESLRSFSRVAGGMMATSFLSTLFQNIYAFFIGNRAGLVPLGYYTQADKWSKMGVTSVSQVLTSSFLPTLSEVQDDPERFSRVVTKMNRATAYILAPAMLFLIAMAEPIFHVLFGTKWDASIILFQLLLARGVFTVLNSLYNNFILARGHSRSIFILEVVRDTVALLGILVTLPCITQSTPANPVSGLTIFIAGQLAASFITWIITLKVAAKTSEMTRTSFLTPLMPYFAQAAIITAAIWWLRPLISSDIILLAVQGIIALGAYFGINAILPSRIQRDVWEMIRKK